MVRCRVRRPTAPSSTSAGELVADRLNLVVQAVVFALQRESQLRSVSFQGLRGGIANANFEPRILVFSIDCMGIPVNGAPVIEQPGRKA